MRRCVTASARTPSAGASFLPSVARGSPTARCTGHSPGSASRPALRGQSDARAPRLHDLCHRFAVSTLLRWYREGIDVERRLPALATYLGHADVNSTYWYCTAVPELLRLASRRAEHAAGSLPS